MQYVTYVAIFLLLIIISYLLYTIATGEKDEDVDNLVYGGVYELTK